MILNLPRTLVYRDGTVHDVRSGKTNVFKLNRARIPRIVNDLEKLGFFDLDEGRIGSQVENADANWEGQNVRHSLAMVDATKTMLAVDLPPRAHRISVTGLHSHLKEYPGIKEFQVFKDCVQIVKTDVGIQ